MVTGYGSQSARRSQQCAGRTGPASAPTPAVHHTRGRWWTTVTSHNARSGSDQADTTGTTCEQRQWRRRSPTNVEAVPHGQPYQTRLISPEGLKQPRRQSSSSRMRVIYHNWSATKQFSTSAECSRDKPPFSFVRGQDLTMWDIICKFPFPSAGTAVSLFRAKTVQQRPLLPREVETY